MFSLPIFECMLYILDLLVQSQQPFVSSHFYTAPKCSNPSHWASSLQWFLKIYLSLCADLTRNDYATQTSFKSLLLHLCTSQEWMETSGCLEHCSMVFTVVSCDLKIMWFVLNGLKHTKPMVWSFRDTGSIWHLAIHKAQILDNLFTLYARL